MRKHTATVAPQTNPQSLPHAPRIIMPFSDDWRFCRTAEVPPEVIRHGNQSLIANETRIWQKAGNHALARTDNPHTDNWRRIELPHDFVIEGPFTRGASLNNGSLAGACAWYVKHFELTQAWQGRRVGLEFDGIYRNSTIFCNGHYVGRQLSGYMSFSVDLTEICEFGRMNAIAVHVDATENELWSYDGGGIYRDVRLVVADPVHVPPWGVFVQTGKAGNPGRTDIQVSVQNATYTSVRAVVSCHILSATGAQAGNVVEATLDIPPMSTPCANICLAVDTPDLWSPEMPVLYRLVVEVRVDNRLTDRFEQPFGFRFFHFDAATGFHLNGKPIKLKGTCCHQDHAGVGVAVPAALHEWRMKQLKALGCNAIRTSHNPPDPALLDACDRVGIMVMDEIRVPGISQDHMADTASLIRRDRNHPSVILWSLGNEEMKIQNTVAGIEIFRRLQHLVHSLDPGRYTTYACNCNWIDICDMHAQNDFHFDVWGCNYRSGQSSTTYDAFHAKHPDWPMLGSETWGGGSTRGLYASDECPLDEQWAKDESSWLDHRRFVSAYANWVTPWGYSIEGTWQDCVKRDFMAGTFIWTGFDYRGETIPYKWPAVITRFGILDLCGFRKEVAHYLRAWWRPEDPHLFLMPHWNWQGQEGEPIRVRCYGNAAEVELFLNDTTMGRYAMPENGKLEWDIPYQPGTLLAIGYGKNGMEVVRAFNKTAGTAAKTRLDVEQVGDILVARVSIVDASGTPCPTGEYTVTFESNGPVRLLGLGNGNPLSHEPDQGTPHRKTYHGLCQAVFRLTTHAGTVTLRAAPEGLIAAEIRLSFYQKPDHGSGHGSDGIIAHVF